MVSASGNGNSARNPDETETVREWSIAPQSMLRMANTCSQ